MKVICPKTMKICEGNFEPDLNSVEIRKAALESYKLYYDNYSGIKDPIVWHIWKKAFHLGYELSQSNKQLK